MHEMLQSRRGLLTAGLSVAATSALPAAALAHGHRRYGAAGRAAHAAAHHGHAAVHHGHAATHLARAAAPPTALPARPVSYAGLAGNPVSVALGRGPRLAHIHNLHTGDSLRAVYFENGRYLPDAMSELMKAMRDWRSGEEHLMDPRLFDVMHALRGRLGTNQPFQIISGYRSKATNEMMHERSAGVAKNSQHTEGKASDVRLQGVSLLNIRRAALDLGAGGVGFYPISNFVHVDVGPVRQWIGV